jgi:HK97 family phage portal protein
MSADMAKDSLRFNRNFLRNSAQPDFVLLTNETMTDNEVEEFYRRWEARFQGPNKPHRPAVASFVRDIKTLGISHREMNFIQGLRWSLEEVSRTYGVPKPLLSDLERATFSNVNAAERFFWRNTMLPEMRFLADQVTRNLFPALGYPDLELEFNQSAIEALSEDESTWVSREAQLLDRGVLTINEVRRSRNLSDVPWGDEITPSSSRRNKKG